jgi:hypothetical protein
MSNGGKIMETKITIKDMIYIVLIVISGFSSYFLTKSEMETKNNEMDKRLSIQENDSKWVKNNVKEMKDDIKEIKTIVLSIGN